MADKGKRLFCPTIIRSPPFYQNFYGSLAGIQNGMLYYPLGESTVTHVDFNDVGKVCGLQQSRRKSNIPAEVQIPAPL